jgi:hypothetical protein
LGEYLKRETEIEFHDELNVPRDELDVHGRCDGICTVDSQGVVVEFKSINKEEMEEAKQEHVGQLLFYIGMMRKLKKDLKEDFGFKEEDVVEIEDLKEFSASGRIFDTLTELEKWLLLMQGDIRGEVIYECKPTNAIKSFVIPYDETIFQQTRLWFKQLKYHVENKEMPQVKYNKSSYPCSWSSWKSKSGGGRCAFWGLCHGKSPE